MMMGFMDNIQKCQEYIHNLEDERRKIQVFRRELPLCLELVTQAIETCKQQLGGSGTSLNGHSECSEQTTTSSDAPVLEEFIPLKTSNSTEEEEHQQESGETLLKKSDWLRSVQLWNPDPHSDPEVHEHQPKRISVVEVNKNVGAFHPFHKEEKTTENNINKPTSSVSATSSARVAEKTVGMKEDKSESRKSRRCWSPELHKRFLHSLQQLGGSHVATPKQIRELMKVDGLTNDEVKSHLQKYRLHTRRPSSSSAPQSNPTPQTTQFVVTGGIWAPACAVGSTMAVQNKPAEERRSPSDGGGHSHSHATSSGSHQGY